MGAKTKEIGGGPATGLADDYVSSLQSLLNNGGMGTAGSPDPAGSTSGIMAILSDLLSPGGGKAGGSIQQMLSKSQDRNVNALRSRFGASGGAAFGTPAAHAESMYRAESAPQITQAITGLQLQALLPLLQSITGLAGKGITQRQTVQEPGMLGQVLGPLSQVASAAMPFLNPAFAAAGAAGGGGGGANFAAPATFGMESGFGIGNADLSSLKGFLSFGGGR